MCSEPTKVTRVDRQQAPLQPLISRHSTTRKCTCPAVCAFNAWGQRCLQFDDRLSVLCWVEQGALKTNE